MWHHELAKVYQVRQNLWAIDEIGKTTLYVYEGEKRVLLLDGLRSASPAGDGGKPLPRQGDRCGQLPCPWRPRQRQLSV